MATLIGTQVETGGVISDALPAKTYKLHYLADENGSRSNRWLLRNLYPFEPQYRNIVNACVAASDYLSEYLLIRYGVQTVRSIQSISPDKDNAFATNQVINGFTAGYRELKVPELKSFNADQEERYYELLYKTYSGIVEHQVDTWKYGGFYNWDLRPDQFMFGTTSPEQDYKEQGEFFLVDNDLHLRYLAPNNSSTQKELENMSIPFDNEVIEIFETDASGILLKTMSRSYRALAYWSLELGINSPVGGKFLALFLKLEEERQNLTPEEQDRFVELFSPEDRQTANQLLSAVF